MSGLILVPLDRSSLAERALPYAVAVVRERHLRLLLVRVLESTPPRGMSLVQEPDARGDLERVAKQLREEAIEVETDISSTLLGTVPEELVGRAQKRGCELIVMSTRTAAAALDAGYMAPLRRRSCDNRRCQSC